MKEIEITPFQMAQRFVGVKEIEGSTSNPQVLSMLKLDESWPQEDEVPWCSAFINYVSWLLRLPRSKSLLARSWLSIGYRVNEEAAQVGFDVVVLSRGNEPQPGPEDLKAPGHVGFFGGMEGEWVWVLGGNQSDGVNLSRYPRKRILGIRRLC